MQYFFTFLIFVCVGEALSFPFGQRGSTKAKQYPSEISLSKLLQQFVHYFLPLWKSSEHLQSLIVPFLQWHWGSAPNCHTECIQGVNEYSLIPISILLRILASPETQNQHEVNRWIRGHTEKARANRSWRGQQVSIHYVQEVNRSESQEGPDRERWQQR